MTIFLSRVLITTSKSGVSGHLSIQHFPLGVSWEIWQRLIIAIGLTRLDELELSLVE